MASHTISRVLQLCLLFALLIVAAADGRAQFGKLSKKVPGTGGGNSEIDTLLVQIDGVRVRSAYARITLSLADDVIRRQALRNSTKKSTQSQVEKDKKEIEALDRSIAEKRKLLADLGRQTGDGKYDEKSAESVDKQLKSDEQQRAERRALVDQEIADKEANEKQVGAKDKENYGKLAGLLLTAAKQEQEAVESARDIKPRAESAARDLGNNPGAMASSQPKRLNEGVKNLNEVVTEGPKHAAALANVAKHMAKIGGIDLTDAKFQPKVVTSEDEI